METAIQLTEDRKQEIARLILEHLSRDRKKKDWWKSLPGENSFDKLMLVMDIWSDTTYTKTTIPEAFVKIPKRVLPQHIGEATAFSTLWVNHRIERRKKYLEETHYQKEEIRHAA